MSKLFHKNIFNTLSMGVRGYDHLRHIMTFGTKMYVNLALDSQLKYALPIETSQEHM